MTDKELMVAANEARKFAYTPYSHFKVGAALLTKSGKLYTEGESDFAVIAVVGGKEENPLEFCSPCGVCRQVLAEFCGEDFRILLGNPEKFQSYTVDEILPFSFTKKDLNKF